MKIPGYICDICGGTVTDTHWTHRSSPVHIFLYLPSNNPMSKHGGNAQASTFLRKDTCNDCRRAIATALADVISELTQGGDSMAGER